MKSIKAVLGSMTRPATRKAVQGWMAGLIVVVVVIMGSATAYVIVGPSYNSSPSGNTSYSSASALPVQTLSITTTMTRYVTSITTVPPQTLTIVSTSATTSFATTTQVQVTTVTMFNTTTTTSYYTTTFAWVTITATTTKTTTVTTS